MDVKLGDINYQKQLKTNYGGSKMKYNDGELTEELDEENEKKSAKEILNKRKVTDFEMDMLFINEDDDEDNEDEDE